MDEQLHFCMHVITTATSLSKPFKTWNDEICNPSQRGEKKINGFTMFMQHLIMRSTSVITACPGGKNTLKLSSPKGMIKISQNK